MKGSLVLSITYYLVLSITLLSTEFSEYCVRALEGLARARREHPDLIKYHSTLY
jgi:hypothetical protein